MRNKATKKNMDLDLRRYGKMLYSKAEESGGSDGSGSGDDSQEIEFLTTAIKYAKENNGGNFYCSVEEYNSHEGDTTPTIGNKETADIVLFTYDDNGDDIAIFLTSDEYDIVYYNSIDSYKSYLKGYIKHNQDALQIDDPDEKTYLNFDFIFIDTFGEISQELKAYDDVDLMSFRVQENTYINIYVPYTIPNNNFIFKHQNNAIYFTKNVKIDTEHPIEINGVTYYHVADNEIS